MRYAAQDSLTLPARPSAQLWRLGLGIVLTIACFLAMSYSYFNILAIIVTPQDWPAFAAEIDSGSSPRGLLSVLGVFGLLTLSLALVMNQLHRRPLRSLIGPPGRAALDFLHVSVALTALGTLLWLLPTPAGMAPLPGLPPLHWAAFLPLALPLVFLQISAEEFAFRGYLQSQLAARFDHPLIWLLLPAAVFGLLHFDPDVAGENAPVIALGAFVFGLAAADLTARAGTLGPALALHFWTNACAILITAPQGNNSGLALQLYPFALSDPDALATWLPYDLMVTLCAWLAARLAITR